MNNAWEDTFIKQFCKTIKQGTVKALLWDGEFANEPQFIIDFTRSLLKQQREICANEFFLKTTLDKHRTFREDMDLIINAPGPSKEKL